MRSTDPADKFIESSSVADVIIDPATRAEFPIDWQQLRRLSEGNEEFELELLHIFAAETFSRLQQAQTAILQRDQILLAHIAHQIKGSSGSIGMHLLMQLAKELEASAKVQDWEKATSQIEPMTRLLTYVQSLLHMS